MHPILFHVPMPHYGTVPIYSYGIMLAISLIVGWFLTLGLASRDGLPREAMANCYVDTAVMALLGSRILYILTNTEEFTSFASLFAMRNGGLVAYGGFLGGLLGSFLSLRYGFGLTGLVRLASSLFGGKRRPWSPLPFLPWADVAVPSLAAGLAITRVGCYLFGCDFGRPLGENAPAFLKRLGTFPRWSEGMMGDGGVGSPAWDHHRKLHLVSIESTASLPVHPTQIYESLLGLTLLVLLLFLRRNQRFRGEIFLWFTFLYGSARFLLELVRDDVERGNVPPSLSPHVLLPLSLGLLGAGYAVSIAPRLGNPIARFVTRAIAFVPFVWAFVATQPKEFESVAPMELSTSQFVGLVSGLFACAGFWVLHRAALLHPESAMGLPDFSAHLEEETEDDDAIEEERPRPSPVTKPKKKIPKKAPAEAAGEIADEEATKAAREHEAEDVADRKAPATHGDPAATGPQATAEDRADDDDAAEDAPEEAPPISIGGVAVLETAARLELPVIKKKPKKKGRKRS